MHKNHEEELIKLLPKDKVMSIQKIEGQASDRQYFRITLKDTTQLIGTYSENTKENDTFFYMCNHFDPLQITPHIHAISTDKKYYIQQDVGKDSLYNLLVTEGLTDSIYELYEKSLKKLAYMQIKGHEGFDYSQCFSTKKFDKQTLLADFYYFKFCFVDALGISYDKQALADDFDTLVTYLESFDNQYFMFRDFQSRNIQVKENEVYFIDFQGGMNGSITYDVGSLLWQSRAQLPLSWKEKLLDTYISYVNELVQKPIDDKLFKEEYYTYLLARFLQVLGAYGFRGLFERKKAFITAIAPAIENIAWFINNIQLPIETAELNQILQIITTDTIKNQFMSKVKENNAKLCITINSFSYKTTGIPKDETNNGGGYVFDCRGILNPGRIDQYKTQTGRDKEVQDYLLTQTRMPEFLEHVYKIVSISVEDYLSRDFENLLVSFGCTGGQHRSVFAADSLAKYLSETYGVKTKVTHIVQEQKNWINESY